MELLLKINRRIGIGISVLVAVMILVLILVLIAVLIAIAVLSAVLNAGLSACPELQQALTTLRHWSMRNMDFVLNNAAPRQATTMLPNWSSSRGLATLIHCFYDYVSERVALTRNVKTWQNGFLADRKNGGQLEKWGITHEASQKQSSDTHETQYDRVKRCKERKINIKASERVNRNRHIALLFPHWHCSSSLYHESIVVIKGDETMSSNCAGLGLAKVVYDANNARINSFPQFAIALRMSANSTRIRQCGGNYHRDKLPSNYPDARRLLWNEGMSACLEIISVFEDEKCKSCKDYTDTRYKRAIAATGAGMMGWEKREIPEKKKPADQRRRPVQFPLAKIRERPRQESHRVRRCRRRVV
ncbi:hypothetical protein PR048_004957 [Dryococelus australis]|uniref:Uncharacterized protein n=1 Tax=Dryococelus australis TaxID=614101 RepID=A0ABQ9I6V7_9NEOP|nr:hypothetical protein PR048_004957 [Dryococelus australis]